MLREFLARPEVSERCEIRSRFGLMAFHGGNLERTTDVVAAEVAERADASLYAVLQAPPHRDHLPSTAFDPAESEALACFLEHVETVIAVHGYGRQGMAHHVLVGGGNRDLARHVSVYLRDGLPAAYQVVDDLAEIPIELRGQHDDNPVNRVPGRGVQLELPPTVRWNRHEKGWSDHEGVSRTPDVDQLIEALVRAVESWACAPATSV